VVNTEYRTMDLIIIIFYRNFGVDVDSYIELMQINIHVHSSVLTGTYINELLQIVAV
jgi:hypothetical protein